MKKFTLVFSIAAFILAACTEKPKDGSGEIEFIDNELSNLITKDAKVEIIAEGFDWSEGPLWIEQQQMLLLKDMSQTKMALL